MMGTYFYRISLLVVGALVFTACVPVSRAQGIEPAPVEAASGSGLNGVQQTGGQAGAVAYSGPEAALPGTSPVESGPVQLYHPQVYRVAQAPQSPVEPDDGSPRVWMDLSLQPQLVDFFNLWADENDIARIEHESMMDLLDQVTVGRKLVIFKNAADAEQSIPLLADRMDLIGYNLEGGPSNLPEEQADPVGSARRVRNLADAYGLKVALGPSRDFALNYGAEMAPYVDLFVLQVQRVQTEHDTVRGFVLPLLESLLAANPDLEISVQIRTEGDVGQLVSLVDSLGPELAGVSILTSQNTLPTAYELVEAVDEWRRSGSGITPVPGTSEPGTAQPGSTGLPNDATPALFATTTVEPRRTPTQSPELAPVRPGPPDGPTRWFLFGSGLFFGLLVAMLGGTWLVFMFQRMRTR